MLVEIIAIIILFMLILLIYSLCIVSGECSKEEELQEQIRMYERIIKAKEI